MTEQIGRVLGGRYRLLSPLGSSASAEVYVADDVRLHRRVAVKLLHPALGGDEAFLRRFRAEIRAVAALNHPSIVPVYDWSSEAQPYLVSDHMEGGSLRAMLDAGHRLSPSQALVVGLQAAQALDVAHRQGFVHRGLKPANLLFAPDGKLRVADFGLAGAVAEASLTEPEGAITGAARYSSPEQARGVLLTGHSDIYSLALVLIEAVTGKVPFATGTTGATLLARLDQPLDVPDEMSAMCPVLARAGALTPDDRPDAAELVTDLMAAAKQLPRPTALPLVRSPAVYAGPDDADRTMVVGRSPGPAGQVHTAGPTTAQQPAVTDVQDHGHPAPDADLHSPGSGGHRAAPPPKRSGRRPLLPGWAVPTLVVVAALLVGAGGAWFLREASVPAHAVPEALIGSHISEIDTHVGSYGWRINRSEEHADGTEPGQILRTDPEPGSPLREGEELQVVVSLGPTLVDLPSGLEGLPVEEAETRLANAQLEAEIEMRDHDTIPEGYVIGVAEGTGPQVPKGSAVVLLVSEGPQTTVPDLRGWNWKDARRELERLGLEPEREAVRDQGFQRNQVVGTEPAAGTAVEPGSDVTVYVSRDGGGDDDDDDGGLIWIPFVVGRSIDDAIVEITTAGLEVGEVNGAGRDLVIRQDPLGGTSVAPGTKVHLYNSL